MEFTGYFSKLEALSTVALGRSVERVALCETRRVAEVIAHIAEISRRKWALAEGYRNTFEYCVRKLGLSEGSVALRIQVANVSRRFPQVLEALSENRISLTVAGRLAPHLREDNVDGLLARCAGMTKRQVEEVVVELAPKIPFKPSIRKRPKARSRRSEDPTQSDLLGHSDTPSRRAVVEPATATEDNYRFTV